MKKDTIRSSHHDENNNHNHNDSTEESALLANADSDNTDNDEGSYGALVPNSLISDLTPDDNDLRTPKYNKSGITIQNSIEEEIHSQGQHTPNNNNEHQHLQTFIQRSPCYMFFHTHYIFTIISLAMLNLAQYLPTPRNLPFPVTILLNAYMSLGTILCLIIELDDSKWIINNILPSMESWIVRGSVYLLMGLIGVEQSSVSIHDFRDISRNGGNGVFNTIAAHFASLVLYTFGFTLMGCGFLYVVEGVFCLKRLREKIENDYQDQLQDLYLEETVA
jgi:hypothetical protein